MLTWQKRREGYVTPVQNKSVLLVSGDVTWVVTLFPAVPAMARDVMLPLKTELMELKKLDFPAPTGPTSSTLASFTPLMSGW